MHDCTSGCLGAHESWIIIVCCLCVSVLCVFVVFTTLKLCWKHWSPATVYSCYIAILLMRWTFTYLRIQQHTQLTHSPSSRHCSLSLSQSLSLLLSRAFPFSLSWKNTGKAQQLTAVSFLANQSSFSYYQALKLRALCTISAPQQAARTRSFSLSSSQACLFSLLPECLCTTCDRLHYRPQIYTGTAGAALGPAANWASHSYSDHLPQIIFL